MDPPATPGYFFFCKLLPVTCKLLSYNYPLADISVLHLFSHLTELPFFTTYASNPPSNCVHDLLISPVLFLLIE